MKKPPLKKYQCFDWFIWELPFKGGTWFCVLPYGRTPRRGSGLGFWTKDRKEAEYWCHDHPYRAGTFCNRNRVKLFH